MLFYRSKKNRGQRKRDRSRQEEKDNRENNRLRYLKCDIHIKDFDEAKTSERIWKTGKASYVERDQEMIGTSDFCVFYYKETYKPQPPLRHLSSGKSLAYHYAVQKKKNVIIIDDVTA